MALPFIRGSQVNSELVPSTALKSRIVLSSRVICGLRMEGLQNRGGKACKIKHCFEAWGMILPFVSILTYQHDTRLGSVQRRYIRMRL